MDLAGQRRSENVEDRRSDPWSYLDQLYVWAGMPQNVTDTIKSMIEALKHPMTMTPPVMTPWNSMNLTDFGPQPESFPQDSMQAQLGANDVVRALRK